MATFDSIFPTFLAKCGELHTLLLSVAYALFVTGIIVTVVHGFTHEALLRLLSRILLLTSLLVFLPAWGNQIQNLLQDSILSGLGVDPSQVYQQFNQLLVIKRDPATQASWWNVMAQLHNFTTDIIITAILWLVGQLASLMMFWGYIFQTVILNLGYALSPLLIGFMAIPALKQVGTKYLLNLVGVLLWPLGWAVAALVTQGILDFMTDPALNILTRLPRCPTCKKPSVSPPSVSGLFSAPSPRPSSSSTSSPMVFKLAASCFQAAQAVSSRPPPRLRALPRPLPAPAFQPSPLARRAWPRC